MAMTEPRTVKTQLLTELNDLKNALVAGPGSAASKSPMVRNPNCSNGVPGSGTPREYRLHSNPRTARARSLFLVYVITALAARIPRFTDA